MPVSHVNINDFSKAEDGGGVRSRFDDWEVCWLGGWTRDRLSFVVMVIRLVG